MIKRKKFLSRYNPSCEEYRKKMEVYANKVRLLLYNRKLDILSGKTIVREF